MTGGGFGGSVIIVHDPGSTETIIDGVNRAFHAAYGRTPHAFTVHAVNGAGRIQ